MQSRFSPRATEVEVFRNKLNRNESNENPHNSSVDIYVLSRPASNRSVSNTAWRSGYDSQHR